MKKVFVPIIALVLILSLVPHSLAANSDVDTVKGAVVCICRDLYGEEFAIDYTVFCHYTNLEKVYGLNDRYPLESILGIRKCQIPEKGYICLTHLEKTDVLFLLSESINIIGIIDTDEEYQEFKDYDALYQEIGKLETDGVVPIDNTVLQKFIKQLKDHQGLPWDRTQFKYYVMENCIDVTKTTKKNVWYLF